MSNSPLGSSAKLVKSYVDLANTLFIQNDIEGAIKNFEKALNVREGITETQRAKLLFNVGVMHQKQGDRPQAVDYYQQALVADSTLALAQLELQRLDYEDNIKLKGYEFTQDWFSRNLLIWREYLPEFVGRADLNVLEIGSWEGRSACWLLEQVLTHPTAEITCIDTFQGSLENQSLNPEDLHALEARFDANMAKTGVANQVKKLVGNSAEILRSLPLNRYDLIYVDGSHIACDVLTDTILSWGLLKLKGIMIFDDYDFGFKEYGTRQGIDAFLNNFAKKIEIVHQSHQVLIRKQVT